MLNNFLPKFNLCFYQPKLIIIYVFLFRRELDKLENEEAKILKAEAIEAAKEKELSIHREAFVEHLDKNQLYDSLFENDAEGQAALLTGQEAEEIFEGSDFI